MLHSKGNNLIIYIGNWELGRAELGIGKSGIGHWALGRAELGIGQQKSKVNKTN